MTSPGSMIEPQQLWLCCNTLTISKKSPTAERIAWFATQRIQREMGACHGHRLFDIDCADIVGGKDCLDSRCGRSAIRAQPYRMGRPRVSSGWPCLLVVD